MRRLSDKLGNDVDNFILEVQNDGIEGASIVWKFGHLLSTSTSVVETITDIGGQYVYYLGYGVNAKKVDIVSTSASDIHNFYISGLDANGREQGEVVTLTGTTLVTSANTYSRIFRAWNDNSVDLVGNVTISQTATANIVAKVTVDDQQTLMAIYTIPLGYTGHLFHGVASIGQGKQTSIRYVVRLKDKVFRTKERFPIFETSVEARRPYLPIPELSDIEVRSKATSLSDDISASFGILLLDNSLYKA